jgi:hypothetical protein
LTGDGPKALIFSVMSRVTSAKLRPWAYRTPLQPLLLHVTLPAVPGQILPALLRHFSMATDALAVKDLLQAPSPPGTMTFLASDPGLPGFKVALFQDIFPLLIPVMTILAGEALFNMMAMGKDNRRPFPGLRGRAHQRQGLRLSPQG